MPSVRTREAEVLGLIARGLSNPEIAAELFIGEATVKSHIDHAFAKIGVRNRAEAVRYGLEKAFEPAGRSRADDTRRCHWLR